MQFLYSRFWRSFAGFLAGIVLTAIGFWLFFFTKWDASPLLMWVTLIVAAPVIGFVHVFTMFTMIMPEILFETIFPLVAFLPYPLVLTVLVGLAGEPQTKKIMLWEAFTVGIFLFCSVMGLRFSF